MSNPFINFSEMYAAGGSFDMQEVNTDSQTGTQVIYGGYSPDDDPGDPDIYDKPWIIRRLVITESEGTQTIECTWTTAPWNRRANQETVYKFGKP